MYQSNQGTNQLFGKILIDDAPEIYIFPMNRHPTRLYILILYTRYYIL